MPMWFPLHPSLCVLKSPSNAITQFNVRSLKRFYIPTLIFLNSLKDPHMHRRRWTCQASYHGQIWMKWKSLKIYYRYIIINQPILSYNVNPESILNIFHCKNQGIAFASTNGSRQRMRRGELEKDWEYLGVFVGRIEMNLCWLKLDLIL